VLKQADILTYVNVDQLKARLLLTYQLSARVIMPIPMNQAGAVTDGTPPNAAIFPIDARFTAQIATAELRRLARIASRISAEQPNLAEVFGEHTKAGASPSRCVFIGDTREIALLKQGQESSDEYRFSLLARSGDVVVFGHEPNPKFENYRAEYLGLGEIVRLVPAIDPYNTFQPLADRCRLDAKAFSALVTIAKNDGGLTIAPHIGLGSAWRLASELSCAAGVKVYVASAPPLLTQRINDKLWFTKVAVDVAGNTSAPPTYSAYGITSLVRRIRELGQARVVVKVPDSSGGLGNICLAPQEFLGSSILEIRNHVTGLLYSLGWHDSFPLLVGIWEAPVICSPSAQLWIPTEAEGPPIIEGLFEQKLEKREGVFVGSVPAALPRNWQNRLAYQAMQFATIFQLLGYFGRCSLDAIIAGTDFDSAALHWIECNGRWGGVSIPMTILHRLNPASARQFVVVQRLHDQRTPRSFPNMVRALSGLLYKRGECDQGIVLLSPSEIEAGRGIQMLVCAETTASANNIVKKGLNILDQTESC
jgi:pre ATP-grasp domain-containing protein